MKKKLFVVCVDRDDDLGRKTGIKGPVIGREKNLMAAQKLVLNDPTESDANTMFASIKKYEEASKEFKNVEVVTITGKGKIGLQADKELNRQLDILTKEYLIDGWILVTDGAEDSQVIPLLQSRGKIISTEKVIIRQAEAVESTYYTIKEALKDPGVARLFLGVPGLILLSYFILGTASFQAMALIAGAYLLLKGFGIEDKIVEYIRVITESLSEQRISFVMYIAAVLIPLVGLWMVYIQLNSSEFVDITIDIASALRTFYPFIVFSAVMVISGKATDSIYRKKAYKLGDYIVQAISILCVWAIIDSGTLVFLRQTELTWLPANIMMSLIILIIAMRLRKIFDVRENITKIFVGLNAIDERGNYLGKVIEANKTKQVIVIQDNEKDSRRIEKKRNEFTLSQGRIVVTA
jgi:putative membrane protein